MIVQKVILTIGIIVMVMVIVKGISEIIQLAIQNNK